MFRSKFCNSHSWTVQRSTSALVHMINFTLHRSADMLIYTYHTHYVQFYHISPWITPAAKVPLSLMLSTTSLSALLNTEWLTLAGFKTWDSALNESRLFAEDECLSLSGCGSGAALLLAAFKPFHLAALVLYCIPCPAKQTMCCHVTLTNTPQASLSSTLLPNSALIGYVVKRALLISTRPSQQNHPNKTHAVSPLHNIWENFEY